MLTNLILAAIVLDLLLGDPRRWPHPVVIMGKAINFGEKLIRRWFDSPKGLRWGGALLVFVIVGGTYVFVWGIIKLAYNIHPYLAVGAQLWLLYTSFALKSLHQHALAVAKPLQAKDLPLARSKVALIVGRDTEQLDEGEIARAAVETVAENTVDGIVAPLCYAFIGGAPLALAYKAVNTLDSMIGYREEHYVDLGRAAAKLDDLANYLPARLSGFLLLLIAPFTPGGLARTWETMKKDRRVHPSPNGGIIEAGVAGALKVQLGGLNYYFGEPGFRGTMGEALRPLDVGLIYQTVIITYAITFLTLVFGGIIFHYF
ncbi:MAG: adenosylcobinamide-phosphate synthase CbiB [Bacillota bacterium]